MADGPKIRYDVGADVAGSPELEKLARDLEQVDAAFRPEVAERARELAAEIRALGAQQAAIAEFRTLREQVDAAGTALLAAQERAQAFARAIAADGEPTTAQAGRLERLGAAAEAARVQVASQTAALEASRGRLAALGIDAEQAAKAEADLSSKTAVARAELQELGNTLRGVQARALVDELRQIGEQQGAVAQLRALGAATDQARNALTAAETAAQAYAQRIAGVEQPTAAQVNTQQRLGFAVDDARAKFTAQAAALEAAGARLQTLGVETGDLAAAEERLRTAAQATLQSVQQLGQQQAAAQRFAELAETVDRSRAALVAAEAAVSTFRAGLSTTGASTAAEATELQRLNEAAGRTRQEFEQQDQALAGARAALVALSGETAALAVESQRAAATGDRVSAAFQALGAKGFGALQAEAAKVRAALVEIQASSRDPLAIKVATEAAEARLLALDRQMQGLGASAQTAGAGIGSGLSAGTPAMEALDAAAARTRRDIDALGGSTSRFAAEIAELRKLDGAIDPGTAQRARELSAALQDIGRQDAAIARFAELRTRTDAARAALAEAQTAAQNFSREIAASGTATAAEAAQQEKLAAAVRVAKQDVVLYVEALDGSRGALSALGIAVEGLAQKQASLRSAAASSVADLRALGEQQAAVQRFQELAVATERARAALSAADTSLDAFRDSISSTAAPTAAEAAELERLTAAARAAQTAVQAQAQSQADAAAALRAAGVDTDKLVAAQTRATATARAAAEADTAAAAAAAALADRIARFAEGQRQIEALAADLQRLGNAFDPTVATRAKDLGDQLARLGAQSTAIERFQQLEQSVQSAGLALTRAETQLQAFTASIAETATPTRQQAAEIEKLNAAVASAGTALTREKEALDAARPALERLGVNAANLAQRERDVVTATTEARAAIAALGSESERTAAAGEKLSAAWSTLGVRSFRDVQTEAAKVRAALLDIQATSRNPAEVRIATEAAQLKLKALGDEITGNVAKAADGLVTKFAAVGAAIAGVGFAVKPIYDLAVQTDTLRRVLTQIEGSAAGAEKQIQFLRDTAQTAGVSVKDLSDAYVRFESSARSSGISTQVVNDVFAATARAAGNLGLSSEKVTLILDALGQMAAKQIVSMEELRQQLGDSLPGALGLMAKGLGLTQAELIKVVESGQLLARDALPALATALQSVGGNTAQVEGLSASFNRFKNIVVEAGQSLLDGPIGAGAGKLLTGLGYALSGVTVIAVGFNQALAVAGKTLALIGAVLTGNIASFQQFKEEFAAILDDAAEKVVKFENRVTSSGDAAKAAGDAAAQGGQQVAQGAAAYDMAGTAAGKAAQAHQQAAAAATASGTAHSAAAAGASAVATAQSGLATSTSAAADAAGLAGVSWTRLSLDYTNLNAEIERGVKVAEKLVTAKKLEGEAAVAMAQASGNEYAALQAEATAAANNAAAQQALTDKRLTEVSVLKAQLADEKALAEQLGDPGGERAKQITAIENSIRAKEAEAEASVAATEKQKAEAEGRKLLLATYADNSAALGQLKDAYESTKQSVADMTMLFEHGVVTEEQLVDTKKRATEAERLYRDAVNDTVAAAQRRVATIESEQRVTQAGITVDQAKAAALVRVATAQGNTALATEAAVRGKQLEIEAIEKSVDATNKEQDAIIAALKVQRDSIDATDPLLKQKQQEIDARIKNAEATKIEAQARLAGIPAIQAEIDAMQRQTQTAINLSKSVDEWNAKVKSVLDSTRYNADGFAINADKSVVSVGSGSSSVNVPDGSAFDEQRYQRDLNLAMQARTTGGGQALPNPQNYIVKVSGTSATPLTTSGSKTASAPPVAPAGFTSTGSGTSFVRAPTPAPAPAPTVAPTPAPAPATVTPSSVSTSHTVTINIADKATTVQMATAASADQLVALLASLDSAKRSAGYA